MAFRGVTPYLCVGFGVFAFTVVSRFVLCAVVSRHLFSFVSGGSFGGGFVLLN